MTTALVLGGADCLWTDVEAYTGPVDGVVACNDAGTVWPGFLDAWVSLHPESFPRWTAARAAAGHHPAARLLAHQMPKNAPDIGVEVIPHKLPGMRYSANSGLFAAKVALCDLEFDRVVFCGVPLTPTAHFFDPRPWKVATQYHEYWAQIPPEYAARMRSMSGWTRELLGAPDGW